jgi:hypothetical protein
MSRITGPTILTYQCPVTGKVWESNEIAIPTRLYSQRSWESQEKNTHAGLQPCPEVQEKLDAGYVALVAIDPDKSEYMPNGNVDLAGAYRTGQIAYMKREVIPDILGADPGDHPMIFIDSEVANQLEKMDNVQYVD